MVRIAHRVRTYRNICNSALSGRRNHDLAAGARRAAGRAVLRRVTALDGVAVRGERRGGVHGGEDGGGGEDGEVKQIPSEYFLGAILRGYAKAERDHGRVEPCAIWDNICMECMRVRGRFEAMFAWDTRKSEQNRIGTIIESLEAGLVPGLRVVREGRRAWVERT